VCSSDLFIMTIQAYYHCERFGPWLLKNEFIEELGNKTIDEMKNLLGDIKFAIPNKNTGNMIQRSFPQIIAGLEPIISSVYDVKGLAQNLVTSEAFKDVLAEFALESQTFTNVPASTRLCYEIAKVAFITHEMNDAKRKNQIVEKPVMVSSKVGDVLNS